jgi:hypothetical protein
MKRIMNVCVAVGALALTASAQSVATTITQTPGNYSRTTTVTGANGKTATYQDNAAWGNGSFSDNQTLTGFNGKTAAYQNVRSWGDGVYTDSRSATGFNGATRTASVSRSGGVVTRAVTGRNGNSRTFSRLARRHR